MWKQKLGSWQFRVGSIIVSMQCWERNLKVGHWEYSFSSFQLLLLNTFFDIHVYTAIVVHTAYRVLYVHTIDLSNLPLLIVKIFHYYTFSTTCVAIYFQLLATTIPILRSKLSFGFFFTSELITFVHWYTVTNKHHFSAVTWPLRPQARMMHVLLKCIITQSNYFSLKPTWFIINEKKCRIFTTIAEVPY